MDSTCSILPTHLNVFVTSLSIMVIDRLAQSWGQWAHSQPRLSKIIFCLKDTGGKCAFCVLFRAVFIVLFVGETVPKENSKGLAMFSVLH